MRLRARLIPPSGKTRNTTLVCVSRFWKLNPRRSTTIRQNSSTNTKVEVTGKTFDNCLLILREVGQNVVFRASRESPLPEPQKTLCGATTSLHGEPFYDLSRRWICRNRTDMIRHYRSRSMARVTSLDVWPVPWLSSSSMDRRSLLCDAKPSTSLESSSVRSVRKSTHNPRMNRGRTHRWTTWVTLWAFTDLDWITVKYHAYLRKMTRYNPTRGGICLPTTRRKLPIR